MRKALLFSLTTFVLASCQPPAPNGDVPATAEKDTVKTVAPMEWSGLYADTLWCADCPGSSIQLDLRPDSLFILREMFWVRDSIPNGHIGTWSIVKGELLLTTDNGRFEHWRSIPDGLECLGPDGKPVEDAPLIRLHRVKNIEPSPMRITGAYVFNGGSHSFKPCECSYAFPIALDAADSTGAGHELEQLYAKKVKRSGDSLFVRLVAEMRIGPAMEGEGTDDYLYVDQVDHVLDVQRCR